MACKFCNKKVYYDTTWYHSDGGYGDNDYGGVDVNQIAVRICPNCGEIKVPEKFLEDENAKNEFILNTLASMLVNNVKNMNIVGEEKIRETIDRVLKLSNSKYSDKLLEKNGLVFNEGSLFCVCGKELFEADDVADALYKLSIFKSNYCDICGKSLKHLDTKIEAEQEAISAEVETKKTWDRRDR